MDEAFGEAAIKNAFELWFNPEVAKRQAEGTLPTPCRLDAAQAIFPPSGGVLVRINQEVKGIAYTRVNRPVDKGESVLQSDWEGLQTFDVAEEDLDSGHFTVLLVENQWFCTFNFLRRRAYCASLIVKAREFLIVAKQAQSNNLNAPAVDCLFSAAELASKVYLILHGTIEYDTSSHKSIHSGINKERRLDNVNSSFVDLFNKLSHLRLPARYNAGASENLYLTEDDFELVEIVINDYSERCQIARPQAEAKPEAIIQRIAEAEGTLPAEHPTPDRLPPDEPKPPASTSR